MSNSNIILATIKDNCAVAFNSYEQARINVLRGVGDKTDEQIIYVTETAADMPTLIGRANAAWLRNRISELMSSIDLIESEFLQA